jgi:NAD(P)-dependent dehydrogenase (short-subunit alcohol dehydrogenase family)
MEKEEEKEETPEDSEDEVYEEEDDKKKEISDSPVLYKLPVNYYRMARQGINPGHLVQRKWLQKGKEQGFVSVPFASAAKGALSEPDVNICLVGRRERTDQLCKAYPKVFNDAPVFEITGEVEAPRDLDPLEPAWDTPLDELPTDDEVREMLQQPDYIEHMTERFYRKAEELEHRGKSTHLELAPILRHVVKNLPAEFLEEENRILVRRTVLEIMYMLWDMHRATGASRMRYRLACTDGDSGDDEGSGTTDEEIKLRAYFLLAGEGLDFVPNKFIDRARVASAGVLSPEQLMRLTPEEWAKSVAVQGANITTTLRRVPPGWTVYLKGDAWPEMASKGAVYHLTKSAKRLFVQVDHLEGPPKAAADAASKAGGSQSADSTTEPEEQAEDSDSGLGLVTTLAASAAALAVKYFRRSPPYMEGRKKRKEADAIARALQQVTDVRVTEKIEADMSRFEQRMWMEFADADEAPVVLVVGGQSETGKVVTRKLVMSGYHVVVLQPSSSGGYRVQRTLPQGATLASTKANLLYVPGGEQVSSFRLPDDLYDAVAGIDKLVICQCDEEKTGSSQRLTGQAVKSILSCWQCYRYDFADRQRNYAAKVRIFNFKRDTDVELWDTEDPKRPSDTCYGNQRVGWGPQISKRGKRMYGGKWIGAFYEPLGQASIRSPKLKLNFRRFSGLIAKLLSQGEGTTKRYIWFLRTSDFEETRVQYEFDFELQGGKATRVRMPFNAFRPMRADGVPLPEDEVPPLNRQDVVQMGIVVRAGENPVPFPLFPERLDMFTLVVDSVCVFRTQAEPQVVYVGRDSQLSTDDEEPEEETDEEDDELVEDFSFDGDSLVEEDQKLRNAEKLAEAEIQDIVSSEPEIDDGMEEIMEDMEFTSVHPMGAIVESGLSYTIVKVRGLNEHPGGRYPVSVRQASVTERPLTDHPSDLGSVSRGDAAEIVISALRDPNCVNTELAVGESPRGENRKEAAERGDLLAAPSFEISSTTQQNVKAFFKQLKPNV